MKHNTKKKQNSWLRKLSHSNPPSVKKDDARISISSLRKMVTTKEHEDILKLIENETIPSVGAHRLGLLKSVFLISHDPILHQNQVFEVEMSM